jgi:hypothetical protein
MMEADMNNITKPSRRFALLFRIVFFLYPVATLCLWLWADPSGPEHWTGFDPIGTVLGGHPVREFGMWQRVACFGASMLTGGAVMYVFSKLSRLFTLYARGEFFGPGNVACYRSIGYGLIVQQILSLPEGGLLALALTWNNPAGERLFTLGVDDANVSLVVVGLMIILVSRIMDEGRQLSEEQQLTI